MIAYKLVRKMKDGSLKPLFINKTVPMKVGEWMDSECHPTKGFKTRQGWHCTLTPQAPHLSEKNRVWVRVEVEDYVEYNRPESQGSTWILAQRMKITKEMT